MSSFTQDKHLNKEENFFIAKYFKDTKRYDDMFGVLTKIILNKHITSYKEYSFYCDCVIGYSQEKQGLITKLRILEEKEKKNNPSYAGYVKELTITTEEEFRRKLVEIKDEIEKKILPVVTNEVKVLILLLHVEVLYAAYFIESNQGHRSLQISIEECYKLASTVLKPYSRDYIKTILAMGNFYFKVLKDSDFARSFLEESYLNIVLYDSKNTNSDEDAISSLKENKDLLILLKNNITIYTENI
jgi:hypothetical protein